MPRTIYFDYNATTPLDAGVREAMLPFLAENWGNPSSVHSVGRTARGALDSARYRMARAWGSKPSEVVFTSGGTEANNLAILGTARHLKKKGKHLITSTVEHHAVLHAFRWLEEHEGYSVHWLPVDSSGKVSTAAVADAIRPDTTLVSVMAANNEVGTLQPVREIGDICKQRGVVFHTDAVQAFGKLPFTSIDQFNADLVAVCAHKFHGPKGAGALFIRSPLQPLPTQVGGGHENERRAGTENLASIMGLVESFERHVINPVFPEERLRKLTQRLAGGIRHLEGITLRGASENRLCNTISFTVKKADGIALMAALDLEGICASSGSACSAGSLEPSHVLLAMGVPGNEANALVRFSLGRHSTESEVDEVLEKLPAILRQVLG